MATEFDSSYPSLSAMRGRNIFCSDKAQINGVAGVPEGGGCVAPYQYFYMEDRAGFRVRNNPTDAKVVCGVDYSSADLCKPLPKSLNFGGSVRQDLRLFRMYVPGGTVAVRIDLLIPGMVPMAAAVQFGQPPVSGLSSNYSEMSAGPLTLNDCTASARMVRSVDGYIYLMNDSSLSSDKHYLNVADKERWLYIKVFDFGGGYILEIKYVLMVDYAEYLVWYKTMQPQDWKAFGEEGSGPVIVPSDTVSPSSSYIQPGYGPSAPDRPLEPVFPTNQGTSNIPGPTPNFPNIFFPQQPSTQQPSPTPIFPSGDSGTGKPVTPVFGGGTQSSQPSSGTPVFNQPMPAQKTSELVAGPIRISWTHPSTELKPLLKTGFVPANPFLPGGGGQQPDFPIGQQVKVYAAYIDSDGKVYVANSNAVFQLYQGGDIPCFTANIRSDAVMWPADSDGINPFASLKGAVIPGRSYIFGVTPANVGSSAEDFMKHFRGTWFQLVN